MPKKINYKSRRPVERRSLPVAPRSCRLQPLPLSLPSNAVWPRYPVGQNPIPRSGGQFVPVYPVGQNPVPRSGGYFVETKGNDYKMGDSCRAANDRWSFFNPGTWVPKFPGDPIGGCWEGPVAGPGERCGMADEMISRKFGPHGRSRDGTSNLLCKASPNWPYFAYWEPAAI